MVSQWLSMTMIFIVLSLVQINASRYRSVRQTVTEECLHPDCEKLEEDTLFNGF
jgi:hypothetical protein